jgi:isopentenyl phosphate kinase
MSLPGGNKCAPITHLSVEYFTCVHLLSISQECDITGGDIKEVNHLCRMFHMCPPSQHIFSAYPKECDITGGDIKEVNHLCRMFHMCPPSQHIFSAYPKECDITGGDIVEVNPQIYTA